eukprot:2864301-Rhodomonas_salina.4
MRSGEADMGSGDARRRVRLVEIDAEEERGRQVARLGREFRTWGCEVTADFASGGVPEKCLEKIMQSCSGFCRATSLKVRNPSPSTRRRPAKRRR